MALFFLDELIWMNSQWVVQPRTRHLDRQKTRTIFLVFPVVRQVALRPPLRWMAHLPLSGLTQEDPSGNQPHFADLSGLNQPMAQFQDMALWQWHRRLIRSGRSEKPSKIRKFCSM